MMPFALKKNIKSKMVSIEWGVTFSYVYRAHKMIREIQYASDGDNVRNEQWKKKNLSFFFVVLLLLL